MDAPFGEVVVLHSSSHSMWPCTPVTFYPSSYHSLASYRDMPCYAMCLQRTAAQGFRICAADVGKNLHYATEWKGQV